MSVGLSYSWNRDPALWVDNIPVNDTTRYLMAEILQNTLSITTRLNWILMPVLSVEFYAQPFVSTGEYSSFKLVHDPLAKNFADRFRDIPATDNGDGTMSSDIDGDGTTDMSFDKPDFSVRQLRSTLVVRWEYRPGSVIYLAWQHGRQQSLNNGEYHGFSDLADIFQEGSDNTFLLKINYWISF
jgi:hypothetical protein